MTERCCLRHGHFWRKSPFLCQEAPPPRTHLKGTQPALQPKHHYTGIDVLCAAGGLCRGLTPATLPGVQLTPLMQGKLKGFRACLKSLKDSSSFRPVCRALLAPQAMPSPMRLSPSPTASTLTMHQFVAGELALREIVHRGKIYASYQPLLEISTKQK